MDRTIMQQIANALSTMTILSCLFLKVPQIMNLRERRSAEGMYLLAMLMEIIGFTIVTLYNFMNNYSIMTYLEYPIILLQLYVVIYYVVKFKGFMRSPAVPFGLLFYWTVIVAFTLQIIPKTPLDFMMPFCTPLSGFAKVTYMYGIIMSGNADAVSLTTWVISIFTNLARLFTVFVDSGDYQLMANFIISALLSSGVLVTAVFYQNQYIEPIYPHWCYSPWSKPEQRRRVERRHQHHE